MSRRPFPVAEQVPERFTVRQGWTMLAMGVILLVVFGGVTGWSVFTGGVAGNLETLGVFVLCVLAGIAVILKYKNHRLEVEGDALCYTDIFGKQVRFQVGDIASVRRDLSENPKLLGAEGQVLARCERSMLNFPELIGYLKMHEVYTDLI